MSPSACRSTRTWLCFHPEPPQLRRWTFRSLGGAIALRDIIRVFVRTPRVLCAPDPALHSHELDPARSGRGGGGRTWNQCREPPLGTIRQVGASRVDAHCGASVGAGSAASLRSWTRRQPHPECGSAAEHNQTMPHNAFEGQTPDEMYFGRGEAVPDELTRKRQEARRSRIEQNQDIACCNCPRAGTSASEDVAAKRIRHIEPEFAVGAIALLEVWNVQRRSWAGNGSYEHGQ